MDGVGNLRGDRIEDGFLGHGVGGCVAPSEFMPRGAGFARAVDDSQDDSLLIPSENESNATDELFVGAGDVTLEGMDCEQWIRVDTC